MRSDYCDLSIEIDFMKKIVNGKWFLDEMHVAVMDTCRAANKSVCPT